MNGDKKKYEQLMSQKAINKKVTNLYTVATSHSLARSTNWFDARDTTKFEGLILHAT